MTFHRIPVLLILLAGGACASDSPMRTNDLIERHMNARGGVQAFEQLHALRLALEITEPGFTVRGDYVATKSGYMRIDIYAGDERVFTEAIGPNGGWQLKEGATEVEELTAEGEDALRRGLIGNLYGLHELPRLGYDVTYAGVQAIDGLELLAVDQVAPSGFAKRLYLDPRTFLVVRELETSALHPDLDLIETRQVTERGDYREIDGLLISWLSDKRDIESGEVMQTVRVLHVERNPTISMRLFEHP